MRSCNNLEMVSDDFEQLSSLWAVDASNCHRLGGKVMEKLVEMKSLIFLNISKSPMLKERRGQEASFRDCLCSALFHKDSKFLHNDGGLYFADWSPAEEIKEVGFVLSMCDLCSPSNKAALERVKQEIGEMASKGVDDIAYMGMGQSMEGIVQSLLHLPCGTRAFIAPDDKTNMLLGYCLCRLVDYGLHKLENQNIVIARARMCLNEEGEKYVSGFKLVTADVEEFTDVAGGRLDFSNSNVSIIEE